MTSSSRWNAGQVAPGVSEVTNRYTEVVYETAIARPANVQDRLQRAREELRHEEGTWRDPAITSAFASSAAAADSAASHEQVETQVARGRGRLGSGLPTQSWTTEGAYLGAFGAGVEGDSNPARLGGDLPPRDGARPNLAPRPYLGSAQNQPAVRKQATGRNTVPNDARAVY